MQFGGLSCIDPNLLLTECARVGYPTDWSHKAPSINFPTGEYPGRAWILMLRGQIGLLNTNALQTLAISDGAGNTIAFPNMVFIKAVTVTPGATGDPNAACVVEVADVRWLACNPYYAPMINKQYNVRTAAASEDYYEASMDDGDAWEWQTMLDDIFSYTNLSAYGSSPTLPFTPDGTPEDFIFVASSAWRAYNSVLNRIGCAFVIDPGVTTYAFKIVQVGAADPVYSAAFVAATPYLSKEGNREIIEGVRAKVPRYVTVSFHVQDIYHGTEAVLEQGNSQWESSPVYTRQIEIMPTTSGADVGSEIVLYDDLPALRDTSGTITNTSDLAARAQERANDYYRMVYTGGNIVSKTYRAIVTNPGFFPGSLVSGVCWSGKAGADYTTEIFNYPPQYRIADNGDWQEVPDMANERLKPPDIARATFPNYPNTDYIVYIDGYSENYNVWSGQVQSIRPDTAYPFSTLAGPACWVYTISSSDLTIGSYYYCRLSGKYGTRSSATRGGGPSGSVLTRPILICGAQASGGSGAGVAYAYVNGTTGTANVWSAVLYAPDSTTPAFGVIGTNIYLWNYIGTTLTNANIYPCIANGGTYGGRPLYTIIWGGLLTGVNCTGNLPTAQVY